jgi:thiol-disulfide isomerase/thioredoxin
MKPLACSIAVLLIALLSLGCNPPVDTEDETSLPATTGLTPDDQSAEVTPDEAPPDEEQPQERADAAEPAGRDTAALPAKVEVGEQLPTFSFPTIDEKQHSIEEFIGKPLIINFWGINCPPCREEFPEFVKFYEKYKRKGLEIITLNVDSSLSEQRAFLQHQEMPWILGTDDSELFQKWNYRFIPTSIFVNPAGTVVDVHTGGMDLVQLEEKKGEFFGES